MKTMRTSIISVALCGLALGLVSTVQAQKVMQGKATVVKIKGEARCNDGKTGWRPLKFGDVLSPGTVVQTEQAKGAYVDLVLGDPFAAGGTTPVVFNPSAASAAASAGGGYAPAIDQNVVRLWENTMVSIDKLSAQQTGAEEVTDTQLDLKTGHILGMVKKMSRASKYEIKLPNGVAGIRGTIYELWANGSAKCSAGSMIVSLLDSQGNPVTTVINGDEQFDAPSGVKSPMPDAAKDALNHAVQDLKVSQTTPPPSMATSLSDVQYVSPVKPK